MVIITGALFNGRLPLVRTSVTTGGAQAMISPARKHHLCMFPICASVSVYSFNFVVCCFVVFVCVCVCVCVLDNVV